MPDPYASIDLSRIKSSKVEAELSPPSKDSDITVQKVSSIHKPGIAEGYEQDFEDEEASVPPLPESADSEAISMAIAVIDQCARDKVKALKEQLRLHQEFFDASIKTLSRP